MQKLIISIALLTLFTVGSAQVSADSIQAIIKREVAAGRGKCIIVGIIGSTGHRQVVAEGVLSDADPRKPDENTIFEIGSITKVFTALAMADMSLKGQLDINDPISEYLPTHIHSPTWNGREMTLRSLATHRSGMPRFAYNVYPQDVDEPWADYTADELYQYVSEFQPPDIDTVWRYSNTAYGLLGLILERITNKKLEKLLFDEITGPLRLRNTVITLTRQQKQNAAVGHAETGSVVGFTRLGAISAGGALHSNVKDLLTFAAANIAVIPTNLYPAMQLTHVVQAKKDGNDTYSTMGWTLSNDNEKELLFKDGGMPGFRSFLGIDKINKRAVVVIANSNNSVTDIGRHLLDSTRKIEPYQYTWHVLDTLRQITKLSGIDEAITLYSELKLNKSPQFVFNEAQLNYLGTELRKQGKIGDAIKLFQLNAQEYPRSAAAVENIAETYRLQKAQEKAIMYYQQALALDPGNAHYKFMLERLDKLQK